MSRRKKPMRSDLAALVTPRRGHFLLASGGHGDLSLDRSRVHEQPSLVAPLAAELSWQLDVEVVCGPRPGGALLAELVAAELDAKFCCAEQVSARTYRIPPTTGRDLAGKTVAVVDDVYDTGTALHETIGELEAVGAVPTAVGALVVLQPPRRRGEPCVWTRSMWNLGLQPAFLEIVEESVWPPDECPRCAFGVPLDEVRPTT